MTLICRGQGRFPDGALLRFYLFFRTFRFLLGGNVFRSGFEEEGLFLVRIAVCRADQFARKDEPQVPFLDAVVADDDVLCAEPLGKRFGDDRGDADRVQLFGRGVQDQAGTLLTVDQRLFELFEFFVFHGAHARALRAEQFSI